MQLKSILLLLIPIFLLIVPIFLRSCTDEQKEIYKPRIICGAVFSTLAVLIGVFLI